MPENPRHPFETVIYFRPSATGFLHEITGDQRWGLAQAIREVTGALRLELCLRGLPETYRWALHCGHEQDVFVRLIAECAVPLDDGPREWTEALREHMGMQ